MDIIVLKSNSFIPKKTHTQKTKQKLGSIVKINIRISIRILFSDIR